MNAKQVSNVIAKTCDTLYQLGLVKVYNSPCETVSNGKHRVSWPTSSAFTSSFGTLEQFLAWVREGEFTCLLFDYSIIRVSYEFCDNLIQGHSLLYWPCPIVFQVTIDELDELCCGIELCLESPKKANDVCKLILRSPMRFDFDPKRMAKNHPEVHLHMQFEKTRIHVQRPMCFSAFIKTIFRTFYNEKWEKNKELRRLHEQQIELLNDTLLSPEYCFKLSW